MSVGAPIPKRVFPLGRCRLRRGVKVAHRIANLILRRIEEVRAGNSVDPFIEMGRIRVMLAMLVKVGWCSTTGACLRSRVQPSRPFARTFPCSGTSGPWTGMAPQADQAVDPRPAPRLDRFAGDRDGWCGPGPRDEARRHGVRCLPPQAQDHPCLLQPERAQLKSALHTDPKAFLADARRGSGTCATTSLRPSGASPTSPTRGRLLGRFTNTGVVRSGRTAMCLRIRPRGP
jgi:hypothetical protein